MLQTLKNFDSKTIAGILARTALYLSYEDKQGIEEVLYDELEIRKSLIEEIRKNIQLKEDKIPKKKQIINYIDNELEKIDNVNYKKRINKISNSLLIPSDILKINVIKNVKNFYARSYEDEYERISSTIKDPDREFHYENSDDPNVPSDISIFFKKYVDKYPYRNFNLLVIGQRDNIKFDVHQVWRLYDDIIDFKNDKTLIDIIKNFSNEFGVDIEYNGIKSKFFFSETAKSKDEFIIKNDKSMKDKKGNTNITFSYFSKKLNNSQKRMSMIIAIDMVKYVKYLKLHKFEITI